jgi:hypothetical protein
MYEGYDSLKHLTAPTHKMHDLNSVPVRHRHRWPARSRRDLPIALHRDPVALQRQGLHQLS